MVVSGHQLFDFSVDCIAAWAAHQFGPHLPRAGFIRKYMSWIPVVMLVFPGQFVVYESYVISRPWYAYLLIYSLALGAGGWYVFFEISAMTEKGKIDPDTPLYKFPTLQRIRIPILFGLPAVYLLFNVVWVQQHYRPPDKNIVVVARFSGPEPDRYSPTPEILRTLRKVAESTNEIQIVPARVALTSEDDPSEAAHLGTALIGTRNNASVVLWGWYSVSGDHAYIVGNLAFPRTDIVLPSYVIPQTSAEGEGFDLREMRYLVPLEKLNSFRLQADVSTEVRARSFYVLALMLLSKKQYQKAKQYLDEANSGADEELHDVTLDSQGRAKSGEHARNGPLTDYLESKSGTATSAHFEGKWQVLVARAYAELAMRHNNEALLDCAEAALLSHEPVTYFCLGQVHLHRAGTNPQKYATEAEKAQQDCSVAIAADPKYSAPLGCRADANLLLASLRPDIVPAVGMDDATKVKLLNEYANAVKLEPSELSLRFASDTGLSEFIHLSKALGDWNRYIEARPFDYYGFTRRAEAFEVLGKYSEAETDYSRALSLNGKSLAAYNNRGTLRFQKATSAASTRALWPEPSTFEKRLWDETLSDFQHAVKLSPREFTSWCNLGQAAQVSGNEMQAREAFKNCQSLASDETVRAWAGERLRSLDKGIVTPPVDSMPSLRSPRVLGPSAPTPHQ